MTKHLDDAIREAGSPVELLWNSSAATSVAARVPAEFTNWRDEQLGWRRSAVLFDQSHHMVDLTIAGKDAARLLSDLSVNSYANFPVDSAKQFVAVGADGSIIGDNILFRLEEDVYQQVGMHPSINWTQFQAETGGYDVDIVRDDDSTFRTQGDPLLYRYQVQGPRAWDVIRKAIGQEPPQVRFFGGTRLQIGGHLVRAIRHGMAGEAGFELWGPLAEGEAVRDALLRAGEEFDLVRVGSAAYHTNTLESGWVSRPVPAIYTSDETAAYRRWLSADAYEGTAPLGGSLYREDIADYYLSPYDLDYGRVVRFDHDFIGRDALERQVADGRDQERKKITLVWNQDDVAEAVGTTFHDGIGAKYFRLPLARYADFQHDRVLLNGEEVGFSGIVGYSANYRTILSLGVVSAAAATPGTEVQVVWGEDPNSRKAQVEEHRQVTLRATVQNAPLFEAARTVYRQN